MSSDKPARCMECPYIGCRKDQCDRYAHFYCRLNGQEIFLTMKNAFKKMEWCPLEKEVNKHGGNKVR